MSKATTTTPLHKRPVFRLIVVAVIAFMGLTVLLRPAAHDQHWWKHVGLKDHRRNASAGPERIVFGDEGIAFEANVKHEHNVHVVGGHDNGLPPKRIDVIDENNNVDPLAELDLQKGEKRTQFDADGRPILRPVTNGVDFFADYDVDKVVVDPDPAPHPHINGGKNFFSYINPVTEKAYAMKYISNKPRVLLIQDFMSHKECDSLIEAASRKLVRSQVAPILGSKPSSSVNDVRTSSQAWLGATTTEVKPIVERLLKLTGFPAGSNEELQILRYEKSQKYDAHNDYFDPKMYGAQRSNRAVTVFLYLSDVEEGGETQFPRADGRPPTFDFTSCARGLRVRPRKGQAALFYDMTPNGELDASSLHGGCPVKQGTKWGGTLWLRVPFGGK